MPITYTKMHGLGNDYLYIETEKNVCDDWPALSRQMSHRHLGAGSDGIILIMPGEGSADFMMRIFNADGSEAETCGNGIRCFAKYVFEKGLTSKTEFVIDTLGGPNGVVWIPPAAPSISGRSCRSAARTGTGTAPRSNTRPGHRAGGRAYLVRAALPADVALVLPRPVLPCCAGPVARDPHGLNTAL